MADANETIQHPDGRVELKPDAFTEISASPLFNRDLAPVKVSERNWTTYNYAALWISMAHCIPTYMLSSGLISAGMNWWQALITILLGNTIVLIPILLNSHPGTKYGIPFPVFARAAYGTYGSNLPALMRAIVACGWFGIQAWIGGEALNTFFGAVIPGWKGLLGGPVAGHLVTEWFSFLLFWGLNIYIIYRGMDLLRKVENWAAPFVLIMTTLLLGWAIWKANGLGYLLSQKSNFHTLGEFWSVFMPSLTAMVGFWATLSLNMPDFTRFGKSQRDQVVGQVVALPTTMTLFAAMGVMITSAAVIIYPHMKANELPKLISFRTGGLITGILGILMQPWRLLADPSGYIYAWLVGYSGGLGSIAGVLIADYWLVRKREMALGDLYRKQGVYAYAGGWNWRAVVATLIGCACAWIGLVVPKLSPVYNYAWFVGFGAAGLTHLLLMQIAPPVPLQVSEDVA